MRPLLFGLSRNHGGQNIVVAANRFVEALTNALGTRVELHMAGDYANLLDSLRSGHLTMAWVPPFVALRAVPGDGTLVAVSERVGSVYYRSALVVANTSRFQKVEDLRGARVRVAWGDRQSAAQYILPRNHLLQAGLRPGVDIVGERFVSSSFSICAAVANGEVDLGAVHCNDELVRDQAKALDFLKRHYTAAPWRLRVIAVTDRIPADGIVIARSVDEPLQARIAAGLHALHETPAAKEAMRELMNAERLVPLSPTTRSDYKRLEEIAARIAANPPHTA